MWKRERDKKTHGATNNDTCHQYTQTGTYEINNVVGGGSKHVIIIKLR